MVLLKPFLDILFSSSLPELPSFNNTASIDAPVIWFNRFLIGYIQEYGKSDALLVVCGMILFSFFFKNLFRYLSLLSMVPVRNGIEYDIRKIIFQKIMELPLSYFSNEKKGDIMSRMSTDVGEIQWSILRSLENLVRSPIMIFGSLAMMLYISPLLTGFSFGLFLFVGIGIGWLSKSLRKNSLKAQFSLGNLLSIIDEGIGGLRVIKAFTAEKYQEEKFKLENNNYRVISNTIQRRKELASPLSEFLGICVIAALLLFGGNLVFNGQFEASTFVMFILMFYNIIDPAKSFASAVYEVQKGRAAAERINEIIQTEASIKDNPEAAEIKSFNNEISIENLSFSYDEQSEVLKNINLSIKKGKRIALVGMSGSGKSTLADLLIRFQDPTTGQIKLDGIDIKKYKMKDLRQLFGIVTQEPILFHDSILNNIKFGLENVSEVAIMNAAKIANAHDFILQTEHGYQTVIGDRGMKLSGGQRQRLTLARAILRNPQILILDEATSSLDSESEKAVQIALENILKDRTSVIIAHRLSTIQNADEIIVLDAGQIVETGRHEELLQKNGFYRKMVDLQRL